MDFELTISGLCVLALRRANGDLSVQPTRLEAAQVLCVEPVAMPHGEHGHHMHGDHSEHRPRLSYDPRDLITQDVVADLVVDATGETIASLDLAGKTIELALAGNLHQAIEASWGDPDREAPAENDETEQAWLNWIPSLQDLGFDGLNPAANGGAVQGASVVLSLPNGILSAHDIVRGVEPPDFLTWEFPATRTRANGAKKQAIANDIRFVAKDVASVTVTVDGQSLTSARSKGVLKMSISNDLAKVTPDFTDGSKSLRHLGVIQGLASGGTFKAPEVPPEQKTGHPICNQALFIF